MHGKATRSLEFYHVRANLGQIVLQIQRLTRLLTYLAHAVIYAIVSHIPGDKAVKQMLHAEVD
ncbi:MAG TPA: hypothetical protein V6C85_01660 [Allocoleopsis sp.]